jgi:hypothetical protein
MSISIAGCGCMPRSSRAAAAASCCSYRIRTVCAPNAFDALRQEIPDRPLGPVLDSSGSHGSDKIRWPPDLFPIPPPAYSPELNPAERWFEELRRRFANRLFDTLEDLERALTEALRPYWDNPGKLQRLTGFAWWCEAARAIAPS